MSITEKQKRWLKKRAHHLKPVVIVGQAGLTEAVLAEIGLALEQHELIKIKVSGGDRELRDAVVERIATQSESNLIKRLGNTASFFRANPKKKAPLALPDE